MVDPRYDIALALPVQCEGGVLYDTEACDAIHVLQQGLTCTLIRQRLCLCFAGPCTATSGPPRTCIVPVEKSEADYLHWPDFLDDDDATYDRDCFV